MNTNKRDRHQKDHRPIRSFVLRKGRLTSAQQAALRDLWPRYGIDSASGRLDFTRLFGRNSEVIADIGFGNGESTWQMAQGEPDADFIGIEVHEPGVGQLLMALEKHGLGNVRIACEDAVTFLSRRVADGTLAGARIYFPDPWPKKRHHKRRIIQRDFVAELARCVRTGGVLHLATDWQDYADHMLEVMATNADFESLSPSGDYCETPPWRPRTRYERRGERLGHTVRDLLYRRL